MSKMECIVAINVCGSHC